MLYQKWIISLFYNVNFWVFLRCHLVVNVVKISAIKISFYAETLKMGKFLKMFGYFLVALLAFFAYFDMECDEEKNERTNKFNNFNPNVTDCNVLLSFTSKGQEVDASSGQSEFVPLGWLVWMREKFMFRTFRDFEFFRAFFRSMKNMKKQMWLWSGTNSD